MRDATGYRDDFVHVACFNCGYRMVVNNYEDKQVRVPTIERLPVCPWCTQRIEPRRLQNRAKKVLS